jgi:hypothetical protein
VVHGIEEGMKENTTVEVFKVRGNRAIKQQGCELPAVRYVADDRTTTPLLHVGNITAPHAPDLLV